MNKYLVLEIESATPFFIEADNEHDALIIYSDWNALNDPIFEEMIHEQCWIETVVFNEYELTPNENYRLTNGKSFNVNKTRFKKAIAKYFERHSIYAEIYANFAFKDDSLKFPNDMRKFITYKEILRGDWVKISILNLTNQEFLKWN